MDIIICGIDLHYEQSNLYCIDEATGKEFYRVVPAEHSSGQKISHGKITKEGDSGHREAYFKDRVWRFEEQNTVFG